MSTKKRNVTRKLYAIQCGRVLWVHTIRKSMWGAWWEFESGVRDDLRIQNRKDLKARGVRVEVKVISP